MEFIKQNFDKILMSLLFIIMIFVFLHSIHHGVDAGSVSWLQTTIGQILAALFTLVVSKGAKSSTTDISSGGPTIVTTPAPDPPKS